MVEREEFKEESVAQMEEKLASNIYENQANYKIAALFLSAVVSCLIRDVIAATALTGTYVKKGIFSGAKREI